MSVLQNINGSLYRMDASDLVQLAAVDTEGILGGTPGATTDGQTLVDQLAADDVHAQSDIGQIKTDLSDEVTARSTLGAYNFFKVTIPTTTASGITFTVDDNGVITTGNQQATGNVRLPIGSAVLNKGRYRLSGAPNGTFYFNITTTGYNSINETGSGVEFDVSADNTTITVQIAENGTNTANNLIFKPMITLASDADLTFQPYSMTNRELTDNLLPGGYVTTGLTPSNMSIVGGGYFKIGRLCCVALRVKANASISGNVQIKGFPAYTTYEPSNNIIGSVAVGIGTDNIKTYIYRDGTFVMDGIVADKAYEFNCVYLCN